MESRRRPVWLFSEQYAEELIRILLALQHNDACELVASRPLGFFLSRIDEQFRGRLVFRAIQSGPSIWRYFVTPGANPDRRTPSQNREPERSLPGRP